jgi:hypothetical protein
MKIDWGTTSGIIKTVHNNPGTPTPPPFDHLANLGTGETPYKKSHKSMTVVVHHDRNRVV